MAETTEGQNDDIQLENMYKENIDIKIPDNNYNDSS